MQIQQKGLDLTCSQSDMPLWVVADLPKLKQVLLNILYNATKFTEAGAITVAAHIETKSDRGTAITWPTTVDLPTPFPRVVVSVTDTGIGIAPSQQEKLFQPFVMADGSRTRKHEGTGLGLAISRNLMNLMGGSITLYSAGLGQGTQVILALPLVNPERLSAADLDKASPSPISLLRSSSVSVDSAAPLQEAQLSSSAAPHH